MAFGVYQIQMEKYKQVDYMHQVIILSMFKKLKLLPCELNGGRYTIDTRYMCS